MWLYPGVCLTGTYSSFLRQEFPHRKFCFAEKFSKACHGNPAKKWNCLQGEVWRYHVMQDLSHRKHEQNLTFFSRTFKVGPLVEKWVLVIVKPYLSPSYSLMHFNYLYGISKTVSLKTKRSLWHHELNNSEARKAQVAYSPSWKVDEVLKTVENPTGLYFWYWSKA